MQHLRQYSLAWVLMKMLLLQELADAAKLLERGR